MEECILDTLVFGVASLIVFGVASLIAGTECCC